jgi:hypothetical protein
MAPDGGEAALKLRAEDADDLAVLAACLQDGFVAVRDLAYAAQERVFVFVANRFRWEDAIGAKAGGGIVYQRVLCAITFGTVNAVSYRGFRRNEDDRILSLLTIRPDPDGKANSWPADGSGAVYLEFSGGASIRLAIDRISCRAEDFGEPWPTRWHPSHDEETR